MSAHWPKRCTGMMALVRWVILALASSTSRLKHTGQISQNTGTATRRDTAPAVAKKVKAGQSTSSPGLMFRAMRANSRASVPEETASACLTPTIAATSRSKASISGPMMKRPWRSTCWKAACNSCSRGRFWALTSSRGTGMGGRPYLWPQNAPLPRAVCRWAQPNAGPGPWLPLGQASMKPRSATVPCQGPLSQPKSARQEAYSAAL